MINNVSVSEELAVKNKELYLNKLNIDLDNNFKLFQTNINNIIFSLSNDLIIVIISILNKEENLKNIENIINDFFKKYSDEITNYLTLRYSYLKEKIEDENYETFVNIDIINEIKQYYLNNCPKLVLGIKSYDDFTNERIEEYIQNTFYNKLINRINIVLNDANQLLINNYYESKERYKLMNEKTSISM